MPTNMMQIALLCSLTAIPLALHNASKLAEAFGLWAKAGTLACSSTSTFKEERTKIKVVSCEYRPTGGTPATFAGKIIRYGHTTTNSAKKSLLIWTVFGTSPDIKPKFLSGAFVSIAPRVKKGVGLEPMGLVGGWKKSIRLVPATTSQTNRLKNSAASILELQLTATQP